MCIDQIESIPLSYYTGSLMDLNSADTRSMVVLAEGCDSDGVCWRDRFLIRDVD